MSLFDSQEKLYEFIKTTPVQTGATQHLNQLTVGAGESSIIQMDSEAAKFGGRTLTDAKAYIKTDGTYKFKDASGNDILTNLGLQTGALSGLISIQGWTSNLTFSATDNDTVAWTLGTITLTDGTAFSITAGNTGNIAALTYIYFDKAVSTTVLQTTTTAATAVGANKIMIAVAKNTASGELAEFQVFGGAGGVGKLITADNIAANTITANEIATNTITASQMNVATLSAISANLGTITAGTITGAVVQTATTGYRIKMNYSTNAIEFLSNDTVQTSLTTDGSNSMILTAGGTIKFDLGTDNQTWLMNATGFYPVGDKVGQLGSSDHEWLSVRSQDYYSGSSKGITTSWTHDPDETHEMHFVSGLLVYHQKV